jgi:hypothetical protein
VRIVVVDIGTQASFKTLDKHSKFISRHHLGHRVVKTLGQRDYLSLYISIHTTKLKNLTQISKNLTLNLPNPLSIKKKCLTLHAIT